MHQASTKNSPFTPLIKKLSKPHTKKLACSVTQTRILPTIATTAQQLINQAKITITDSKKCFEYLDDGVPPPEFDHDCRDLAPTLEFIKNKLDQFKPSDETEQSSSSSSTSTPVFNLNFNFPSTKPSSSDRANDEEMEADEQSRNEENEEPSFTNTSNRSSTSTGKRGRRKSIFIPTGYQRDGGKITYNKQRTQGCVFKMEWKSKPGYSSWLTLRAIIL